MFFSKAIFTCLAPALLLAGGVRADDCSEGPVDQLRTWGKVHTADGGEGIGFCHTGWKAGNVVTGMEVWANKFHVKGIQFTFSDGTKPPIQGMAEGDRHDAINWGPQDPISEMKLWTNKDGKGLGAVYIEVAGKKLEVKSNVKGDGDNVATASGILIGASGEGGGFVHAFTPLFLGGTTGKAKIVDIVFDENLDEINKKQEGIESISLHDVWIKNNNPMKSNGSDQAWTFTGSIQKTKSSSLSTTDMHTFGVETSIEMGGKVGLPFVAQGEVKVGFKASYSYQKSNTATNDEGSVQTLQWSQASTVSSDLIKPGHARHCKATAYQGDYSGAYTSTVKITVAGKDFTYQQRGEFISTSFSGAFSECNDVLISEIPSDANIVDAPDTMEDAENSETAEPKTEKIKRELRFRA